MKKELDDKKVMVMYDVRGIQKYIFNTNKVRDIIGASLLIERLLEKGLDYCEKECEKECPAIKMDRQFIGGGNACVMFENGKEAQEVNRKLAAWVREQTYSLQLAIAAVEKTDSYADDYKNLQEEMSRVKMKMLPTSLVGALPIVKREEATGHPITAQAQGPNGKEFVSTEVKLKRAVLAKENNAEKGKKFDEIVEAKGEDSTLAVVHIDGNSMGKRIKALMDNVEDYEEASDKMATVSENINASFNEAYKEMISAVKNWAAATKGEDPNKDYVRKIICAGDDITFVCTGKLALSLVETFTHALNNKVMWGKSTPENIAEHGFSICAGIAYMHSHFPFSNAYNVAEMCCANAKERAKEEERMIDGIVGNWVDFQICKDVQSVYLKKSREKNYRLADGGYLLQRPYYIPYNNPEIKEHNDMDAKNEIYSIENLKAKIHRITPSGSNGKSPSKMVNSDIKEIRNTYPMGKASIDKLISFLKSRGKDLGQNIFAEDETANWYDATEIYELYTDINIKPETKE